MTGKGSRCYAIVGSGVAAMAAVQAIRSLDSAGEITVITEDPFGYYSRPGLAYFLTGELAADALYPFSKKDLRALNLNWVQSRVVQIHPAQHRLSLSTGATLAYDRLLIATGSQASPLTAPGAQFEGVFKLDNMTDARAILKYARRGREAVVVGGGITALELVEGLRAQGKKVHYLLRGDRYWSNVLDETESTIIQHRLEHDGIQIHYQTELDAVLGKNNRVNGVRAKDGRVIPCDLVAFAIGVLPRKELAETAGLAVERGIVVDLQMQTGIPDIFAAGDVAQVFDPLSGQTVLDTLWTPAREEGHTAGLNMAGQTHSYQKRPPLNVTRLAGLTTTIIGMVGRGKDSSLTGIARGDSETWRMLPDTVIVDDRFEVNRQRVMVGENRLLGAVVMGDQTLSRPLEDLVANQVDISPIRAHLLQTRHIAEVIVPFWNQWRSTTAC